MLKYIEAHDFHVDPAWADISLACAEAVAKAAEEHGADFIITSDFFNRPLYATDRGGYNLARKIIKLWSAICPVAAVEGTPSHDGKGCYGPLEDCGLVLLRPGKIYGLDISGDYPLIEEINIDATAGIDLKAILFGVPELSNREIVAQLGLPADQANAEAIKYFERYVTEFIAPRRAQFQNIPAIGVLHGVVSDAAQENSSDRIVRASDIVIKTSVLALAGCDRWSLGHFHRPQEFTGCCAGYAGFTGIDDTPWNQTGFVPAMNLVEIDGGNVRDIKRINYGTPRREKIEEQRAVYDPSVAYWLDADEPSATVPAGAHPWSRVTHRAAVATAVRVTAKAFQAAQTLPELAKLFDQTLPASVAEKLTLIEAKIIPPPREAIDVSVDWVEITDSIFWPGKTMRFTIADLERGLTALLGANGDGKSALLSFCTPYPAIVGKDTDSGRQSAIKDFFTGPRAQFKKGVTLNGVAHEHIINIKGAHTKTAKVECTLSIAGDQKLDRGTWDEMFTECERLYGPFADYLLTTFYVQPQQGKYNSGLMNATMTDIRDLVQSIAGIDRENEKRFALDEKARCEKEIEKKTNWIAGAEENVEDEEILIRTRAEKVILVTAEEKKQTAIIDNGKAARAKLDQLAVAKRATDREIDRRKADADKRTQLSAQIESATQDIEKWKTLADGESELRETLKKQQERDNAFNGNLKLKNAYDSLVVDYRRELSEKQSTIKKENDKVTGDYYEAKHDVDFQRDSLNQKIKNAKSIIDTLNRPCFNCGKIDPKAEEEIDENKDKIIDAEKIYSELVEPTAPILKDIPAALNAPAPTPPQYSHVPEVYGEVDETLMDLLDSSTARTKIESITREIKAALDALATLTSIKYNIDDQIDAAHTRAQSEVDRLTREYTDIKSAIATLEAEIKALTDRITIAQETKARIETERDAMVITQAELSDWSYTAGLFQANKLPAFELDQIIGAIDEAATRNIAPYREARYSFRSPTQQEGQKGLIDKFDILVHDNETGIEKSFLKYSPGEKAFLNDAYVKALITARNNRAHRTYSPIISDEADGPVEPPMVPTYYAMQSAFYTGKERVLIVSHAPDAHNYVQNHIAVKELLS